MSQIDEGPGPRPDDIAELIRRRVLEGLRSGTLARGDRLPSTRDLARQFGVDPRAVLAGYRSLADEGLVDMRPRSGIYIADRPGAADAAPGLAERWLVDVFAQGISRDIPAFDLPEWMRRSVETLRLKAAVVAITADQRHGLCRELRADYGLDAEGVAPEELAPDDRPQPAAIRRADIILTTADQAAVVRRAATAANRPLVVVSVRPDLVSPEWQSMLRQPAYVVAVDERFADLLRGYFGHTEGGGNLRTILVGRDDVSAIPPDAPTYVTRAARERLGDTLVPGRIIPTARILSPESARELLGVIIRANLSVLSALPSGPLER